jgi:hypothetical protein
MKHQKAKIGVSGSFTNQLMGNNATEPKVGEWCTFMHYSDRSVGKVVEVSADGAECRVQLYDAIAFVPEGYEFLPHGHQSWKFEPTEQYKTLVWRNKAWRQKFHENVFEKSFVDKIQTKHNSEYVGIMLRRHYPNLCDKIYQGSTFPSAEIKGITKTAVRYCKESVIFGVCDYHYDWSF